MGVFDKCYIWWLCPKCGHEFPDHDVRFYCPVCNYERNKPKSELKIKPKQEVKDMSTTNIFEQASRTKLRFKSSRGNLTVEDLWEIPLSKGDVNLNDIAKGVNKQLKATEEENFVDTTPTRQNAEAQLALDILKHVIKVRQDEHDAIRNQAKNQEEIRRIDELIAAKEKEAQTSLSIDELKAQRAKLMS